MDATTAFVMACIATAIALGGFVLSGLTYWRNRVPRPIWVFDWEFKRGSDGEVSRLHAVARNRGRGVARDVRLRTAYLDGEVPREAPNAFEERAFGSELGKWYEIGARPPRDPSLSERGIVMPDLGVYVTHSVEVVLEWSQEPRVHKRHKKTLRYTVE